ncbi:MAG: rod shape-determining protein MreD [Firmicutes bacterium]|nr:rod shape-determining protein MreD [Bacillota bacterium]
MAKTQERDYLQWCVLVGVTIFAALLQGSLLHWWSFLGIKLDLVLVLVASFTLLRGRRDGVLLAAVGGVLLDVLSGRYLGLHVLGKTVVACLIGLVRDVVYKENYLVPFLATFLGTLVDQGIYVFIARLSGLTIGSEIMGNVLVSAAFFNSLLTLCVYFRLAALERFLRKREGAERRLS